MKQSIEEADIFEEFEANGHIYLKLGENKAALLLDVDGALETICNDCNKLDCGRCAVKRSN